MYVVMMSFVTITVKVTTVAHTYTVYYIEAMHDASMLEQDYHFSVIKSRNKVHMSMHYA